MSVKIIHTADLHLGSGRTGVKNGKTEIENTFFRIIDLCKAENVDFLLIAGDLFDTPFVPHADAERVISAISKIPDTIVAVSPGNHDCACPGSVYLKYSFPDNMVIFNSFLEYRDFPQKGVRLWGGGFTDRFEYLPLLQRPEANDDSLINLCVLHGELVANNSSSTYNPIYPSSIEQSNFDYIALGHIHKRSEIQKLGKTYFSYSGCPDGMGFDEPDSHGVYMGTVTTHSCSLEYIELSSRKYIDESINISDCKNSFEAAEAIFEHIKNSTAGNYQNNLYRITLTGDTSTDLAIEASQICKILSDKLFYIEVLDETTTSINDFSHLANENSLKGVFVRKALERISSASEDERTLYENALKIGLKAFSKGVKLNDN